MSIRVAVVSDTHVGQRISAYPKDFLLRLREFDFVLHAGDHTSGESLDIIRNSCNLTAVRGNMDEVAVSSQLPEKLIITICNSTIGLCHGSGSPFDLPQRVSAFFEKEKPDIAVFGHSHIPFDSVIDGIRLINPGAFSGNKSSENGSWGILTLNDDKIDWELIKVG